jgi:uncharacterized protein YcbK (DUF882 family)
MAIDPNQEMQENKLLPGLLITILGVIAWQKFRNRMDQRLSKNFTLDEFESKDGAETPPEVLDNLRQLAKNLQVLRDYLGKSIKINSGYRSPAHNKAVKGEKNSYHTKGKAADIVVSGYTPTQLAAVIFKLIEEKKISQGGVGIYPTFVHYDIRGKKARW